MKSVSFMLADYKDESEIPVFDGLFFSLYFADSNIMLGTVRRERLMELVAEIVAKKAQEVDACNEEQIVQGPPPRQFSRPPPEPPTDVPIPPDAIEPLPTFLDPSTTFEVLLSHVVQPRG